MAQSRESRALSKSAPKFRAGVDPCWIITKLYENLFMTQSEWNKAKQKTLTEDERLDAVWETLVRRVAVDPSIFHSVVEILRNEPALEKLGDHMKGLSQSLETSRACSDSFFCFVKTKHGRYQFCSIPNSYIHRNTSVLQ